MQLDQNTHQTMQAYVRRHFIGKDQLARLCGIEGHALDSLITAGCAPGVIYSHYEGHDWWSALAAATDKAPAKPPKNGCDWYSPGARWWIRRALLTMKTGGDAAQAAQENERHFIAQFATLVSASPHGHLLFDQSESANTPRIERINETAKSQWADWISGAFGVCLAHFSAQTCFDKEVLAIRIKNMLANGTGTENVAWESEVFDLIERLAPLLLPFSPWERPTGTPGLTIDRALSQFGLGEECVHALI